MLMTILISLFGWLSVARICARGRRLNIFSEKCTIVLQASALLLVAIFIFFSSTQIPLVFFIGSLIGALLFLQKMILWRRQEIFLKSRIFAVDMILLSMQSGKSFRQAVQILKLNSHSLGHEIQQILILILLAEPSIVTSKHRKVLIFFNELKVLSSGSFKTIERLQSWRKTLQIEERFRQKSRTATLQARAQSLVISILYLMAAIFYLQNSTLRDALPLVLSLILFIGGTVWVWILGRRHRWIV